MALLLDGVSATGTSSVIRHTNAPDKHTVACYYTDANASISALTIALEGSIDKHSVEDADAHWFALASHDFTGAEITAKQTMFHVVNVPVTRVRLSITTLTGATVGTDLVYALYEEGR